MQFWISIEVVCLQCYLVVTWLMPCETAAVLAHILCTPYNHMGAGIAQWVEHWTHDRKVLGLSPCGISGKMSAFYADLFRCLSIPHVTAVSHKRSHKLVHGWMVYTELPRRQQFHVAPGMQQPPSTVSTPHQLKLKICFIKKIQSLILNHMQLEYREQRAENGAI